MAPWTVWVSDVQIRARVVLMIASSGPGEGIGLSMKPTSPILFITKVFIISAIAYLLF
jgi:hypothetical protein